MPCLKAPTLPVPAALAGGLSFTPPKVNISFDPALCCKLPPLPTPKVPVKLNPIIVTAAMPLLRQAVRQVNAFLDKLQIKCPRE